MDARRFDSLTKRLGMRRSRRHAVRAGIATVAGTALLSRSPGSRAQNATPVALEPGTTAADRFVAIAYFPYDGDFDEASNGLKPLLRLMQQQPGFITMSFLEGDAQIYLVTWFLDKATSDAGMQVLDGWIGVDEQGLLSNESQRTSGNVFLRSELGAGCGCSLDDDDACGSDDLYCCTLADDERGYCLTSATTCPIPEDDSETAEDDPTPTPTAAATDTAIASCTSEGCDCVAGLDGTCDDGLSCCGGHDLGGAGFCLSVCPCGSEGCACIAAVVNTCDDGLICCAPGEIGGDGTCQYACTCTSEGCACTVGLDGTCDDGLACCGINSTAPGSIGACLTACASTTPCPGSENCECGTLWACNVGLICCGATDDGETGICMTEC